VERNGRGRGGSEGERKAFAGPMSNCFLRARSCGKLQISIDGIAYQPARAKVGKLVNMS